MSIQPPSAAVSRGIPAVSPRPAPPPRPAEAPAERQSLGAVPIAGGPRGARPGGAGATEAVKTSVAMMMQPDSSPSPLQQMDALHRAQQAYGQQAAALSGAGPAAARVDRRA
jgi:hypothetical protein